MTGADATVVAAPSFSGVAAGALAYWPGPDPASLAAGECVFTAISPRPGMIVVVRAIGEVDLLSGRALARTLSAAGRILARDARRQRVRTRPQLMCDLSPVTFFGASGVTALNAGARDAETEGVELVVAAPSRVVRRTLEITGMSRRLHLETAGPELVPVTTRAAR